MSSRGRHVHSRKQKRQDDWSVTAGHGHPGGTLSLRLQREGHGVTCTEGSQCCISTDNLHHPCRNPKNPNSRGPVFGAGLCWPPCIQHLSGFLNPASNYTGGVGGPVAPGSTAPRAVSGTERYQMTSCSVATFCLRLSLLCCVPPNHILKP